MTDAQSNEALKHVDDICRKALNRYIENPWQWPRENDLVGWLQSALLKELDQQVTACIAGHEVRFAREGTPDIQCPRVRLECKVGEGDRSPKEERVDIVIVRGDKKVTLYNNGNGLRDLTLRMDITDLSFLLEVKLYPDLYGAGCPWLEDVEKLREYGGDCPRGVLMVDTSLPLHNLGSYHAPRRNSWAANRSKYRTAKELPEWPIRDKSFDCPNNKNSFTKLESVASGRSDQVYLWALAVKVDTPPLLPIGKGTAESLKEGDVVAGCWTA